MNQPQKEAAFVVRMPRDQRKQLKILAAEKETSMASLVRESIMRTLENP